MKIVIANDSFKGSLEAMEVSNAIEKGIRKVIEDAEIIKKPLADGGEGTVKALVTATKGTIEKAIVTDPLGNKIESFYGILGNGTTAVIEMASASGLNLVPLEKRNPMITTTYGTGELIKAALDKGCRHFIIGIGGSATNDGGVGMAQTLGVKFYDVNGCDIEYGGVALKYIDKIDISAMDLRIKDCDFVVACDVTNPLCGANGASYVYGPQKGATEDMVKELDENLNHLADVVKRDLNKIIKNIPGAGAAGGLGGGMIAFLNAKLQSGIDIVIEQLDLERHIKDADFVITGEGRIDSQTVNGKVPFGVAKVAKKHNVPVIAIAGSLSDDSHINHESGIDAMFSIINNPVDIRTAMESANAKIYIERATEEIFRLIRVVKPR